ncbi:MAG: hypothetical protein ABJB11_05440 [Ferruginibacter sp.]
MKLIKIHSFLLVLATYAANTASAQLFIDNSAQFTIQSGAIVTVQGDVTSNTDILGTGLLQMKGAALQNINMNGFTIPNLEIDNTSNVTLTGNTKVGTSLIFTNGKVLLGTNNLTLADVATVSGAGTSKFVETNGSGQVIKLLTANITSSEIPVGVGTTYRPAFITTTGTYSAANVGVRAFAVVNPNKPPMISDYIAAYWPVTRTGVTGIVNVSGQYSNGDISGTETNLRGYFFNGTDWSSTGEAHDAALNRVTAPIIGASGEIFGMDKFIVLKTKVFLQAAYNTSTGVMADNLRTPSNLIPLSDPYRTATYSTAFPHVANSITESANASVFADQASTNNNIVDWVFLELRNATVSPGNTVLQTRSALLKRDGNIVDVDGVSPVTFNNIANATYTVAIRHRIHLGISADPATNTKALSEAKSTASVLDLTTATDAQIYGTSAAFLVATDGKNVLWAGNANGNGLTNYSALGNDRLYLLNTVLSGSTSGSVSGYSAGDLNMNRIANYSALGNDRLFLLNTVLSGSTITTKTQALPN